MFKSNMANDLHDTQQGKRVWEITPNWAITTLVGALLTGLVTGAFGVARIANTDHFVLMALDEQVEKIERNYVAKEIYSDLCKRFDRLESKVDSLTNAVNNVYKEVRK